MNDDYLDDPLIAALRKLGAVTGGVHRTRPVSEQPIVRLVRYQLFESPSGLHAMGWSVADGEGRVSSVIKTYNPDTKQATTQSGRVYEITTPGMDRAADYVLGVWLSAQNWDRSQVRFIEEGELIAKIPRA